MAEVLNSKPGGTSVEAGGYDQELKRSLGSFQVFAISFAFISVAVGIFATYDDVLQSSGPVGIWLWILVAVGQVLVALVYAQFAGRIVGSVVAASVLGLVFLIALTVAIDHVPRVTASDSPVAMILHDQLGAGPEKVFLVGITAAFFGAGVAIMAAGSRVVFAMSRDSRFPAHRLMRRVNSRTQTPVPGTILIVVVGIILMLALPGGALLKLIIAGTILPALIYGSTIVLYLAVRGRLGHQAGAFSLGRFEPPVALVALMWVLVALFVLVVPGEALVPDLIVAGLLLAGGLVQISLLIFDRQAFEAQPEAVSIIAD